MRRKLVTNQITFPELTNDTVFYHFPVLDDIPAIWTVSNYLKAIDFGNFNSITRIGGKLFSWE